MSEIDNALNEVIKVYNIFRGAEKVKEVLENIKGFETVEKEVSGRIAKLKAEEAKVQAKRDDLLNEGIKARDDAAAVLLQAQAKAVEIEQLARDKANSALSAASAKVENAKDQLLVAEDKLAKLVKSADEKQIELDMLESKIKDTKAALRKLAGD